MRASRGRNGPAEAEMGRRFPGPGPGFWAWSQGRVRRRLNGPGRKRSGPKNLKFGPILLWKNYETHNGLHSVGLKSFGLHSNGLKKFMGQNKIEIKVTNIASYFYLL